MSVELPKIILFRVGLFVDDSSVWRQFTRALTGGWQFMRGTGRYGMPNASRLIALAACLPLHAGVADEVTPEVAPPQVPMAADAPRPTANSPAMIFTDAVEPYARDSRIAILRDGTKLPVSRAGYARLAELL